MSNTKCHPMAKRLLSVLFAITLVTGLAPISAYAATGDSQGTATSSNENGASSSENAIIIVGDSIEWKYNGGQGVSERAIYNKLAENYKYRICLSVLPYTGYKVENKMFTTASRDDKFWKPESRTYDVTGAENFVRWRRVCRITFQKQWDTTFATTPAGEGSIVKQDGSSFADNKDTSNDNATVKFKVEKVNGKTVTVNRYNSKGDKVFSWHQPTLVGEDEKYITYSFTADRNSTVKVEYKAASA